MGANYIVQRTAFFEIFKPIFSPSIWPRGRGSFVHDFYSPGVDFTLNLVLTEIPPDLPIRIHCPYLSP